MSILQQIDNKSLFTIFALLVFNFKRGKSVVFIYRFEHGLCLDKTADSIISFDG